MKMKCSTLHASNFAFLVYGMEAQNTKEWADVCDLADEGNVKAIKSLKEKVKENGLLVEKMNKEIQDLVTKYNNEKKDEDKTVLEEKAKEFNEKMAKEVELDLSMEEFRLLSGAFKKFAAKKGIWTLEKYSEALDLVK